MEIRRQERRINNKFDRSNDARGKRTCKELLMAIIQIISIHYSDHLDSTLTNKP
ncbi:hypothetical protein HanIR_Chr14g0720251 [Helianthus annuus]|nr:hypothetical protein HanIR_Chr14g0720251 [Helianthus annuus]